MNDYTIEKNVPFPADARGRGRKYPFEEMLVGDSILSTSEDGQNIQRAAYQFGKRHNMRFSARMVDDGYRVWRIE